MSQYAYETHAHYTDSTLHTQVPHIGKERKKKREKKRIRERQPNPKKLMGILGNVYVF